MTYVDMMPTSRVLDHYAHVRIIRPLHLTRYVLCHVLPSVKNQQTAPQFKMRGLTYKPYGKSIRHV